MQSDLQPTTLYNLSNMAPLRVLLIEDIDAEAQHILRELQIGGYEIDSHCVKTRVALDTALLYTAWDIIFCDNDVPTLSPIEALSVLQESDQMPPFFLREGTSGAETVVTIINAVDNDFLVKESLIPLLKAVGKELRRVQQ